jgi:hypothetical protein
VSSVRGFGSGGPSAIVARVLQVLRSERMQHHEVARAAMVSAGAIAFTAGNSVLSTIFGIVA